MLKIKKLSAGIEGNKILNNINLDINSGELHVIMGTNGTGKSTLGNILSGNENYQMLDMPKGAEEGILRGLYKLKTARS